MQFEFYNFSLDGISGIAGSIGALGWAAYTFKQARAAGMSTSVFLMHTRVKFQVSSTVYQN